jgi:hypothetical protein
LGRAGCVDEAHVRFGRRAGETHRWKHRQGAPVRPHWPGGCHEHELIELAGLDQALDGVEVASLLDRGFRGLAKTRQHWHAPVGDRRTIDRLTDGQRAFNRRQAGLRALVEQSIAHLANAWALRRWRGLLCRVRDVYRAAGALICLGRWLHRVPT